jgi:two-component system, NtrC family, sensor kinase
MTASPVGTTTDFPGLIAALRSERDAALSEKAALAEELATRDAALAQRNSEFGERIDHQAATLDVLRAMSASPGDAQSVFDLIVRRATELCNVPSATLFEYDGELVHIRSDYHSETILASSALAAYMQLFPMRPARGSISCRAILDRQIIHIRDLRLDHELAGFARELGHRSQVSVPLMRDDLAIGVITIGALAPGGFSDSQIELLKTFAEQAVIAIRSAETYRALQTRTSDLQESLEYQTATSDVLKVISRSTFDLHPVLATLLKTAARLCDADTAGMTSREGDTYRVVATFSNAPAFDTFIRGQSFTANRASVTGRTALAGHIIHIADLTADPEYAVTEAVTLGGVRTLLGVPLLRESEVAGVIILGRFRVEPFTDGQIELVSTFADQAVIAIENTRLITEQREALEQQTATAELLQVINASAGDLERVFDTILEKAVRLCESSFGVLVTYDGECFHTAAMREVAPGLADAIREPVRPSPGMAYDQIAQGADIVHIADITGDDVYRSGNRIRRALADQGGARTALFVALRRDEALFGAFVIYRKQVRPFSDRQIALLQNFAAQAVIAMENARLMTEQREALDQQTATAEVLQVINASPGELTLVFDAMLEKAMRLCAAACGGLFTYDGERFQTVAARGVPAAMAEFREKNPPTVQLGGHVKRLLETQRPVQVLDWTEEKTYRSGDLDARAIVDLGGARTNILVPLLKEEGVIGFFGLYRQEVQAFTDKQIALLENFAAQAVIAIENARLLEEIRRRQEELRVTFENMGDGVAMFDETPRLVAWNRKFQEIFDVPDALLAEQRAYADYIRYLVERGDYGSGTDVEEQVRRITENASQHRTYERTRPDGRVIEIRNNPVAGGGFVLIFSDITERKRNEVEIRAARDAAEDASSTIEAAYRELKTAQANLIQAEKMASLGQLTAGIAHEIKNPLNFVNNFSALSAELIDELREVLAPEPLGETVRTEVEDLTALLKGNLEKVVQHGQRADGIVKSMLEHSRGSLGERRMVDLNALIDEALNLAYHGARAQDQTFTITLERDFGEGIAPIEVNPQDMTRVFLNIFSNGFYAATRRARERGDAGFVPTLKVTARDAGEAVEIRVWDNGTGISADIKDKLFQPFFTTKPTGEGTGLGLSITYDIVTKAHGGSIAVDSKVGEYSEFTIRLPRNP